jgi:hypothetical protein
LEEELSKRGAILKFAIAMIAAASLWPSLLWAHGVVGQRTFIEPLVADDANPKNEFDIFRPDWTKGVDGQGYSLGFSLEKKLSLNTSVTLGSSWMHFSPHDSEADTTRGFDDLRVLLKWAFLTLPEHELRVSIGPFFQLPVGDPDAGAETHTRIGPELLWAWGWGEIPDRNGGMFLRSIAIQGDVGYLVKTGGAQNDHMFADGVIEYSLPYMSSFVKDIGLKWPLRNLIPYVEFNYDQIVNGRSGSTFPAVRVTPGIAYMDYYVELSVGTQLAINQAAVRDDHANVIFLLDFFIDDIFPWTNWTPL